MNNYLFTLLHPSEESAYQAFKLARELNLRVPAQHGHHALEVVATPEEANRLYAYGLFKMKASGSVKKEHMNELDRNLQPIVAQWNDQFSPAYRKAKQDYSRLGRSWADKNYEEPAHYSKYVPEDIIPVWRAEARKRKLKTPPKGKKAQVDFNYRKLKSGDYRNALKYFRKQLGDTSYVTEVGDLFVRCDVKDRHLFFNSEWLKLLIEILIHYAAGNEPACRTMHGRNSVGIVFVNSSRENGPKFSTGEQNTITNEIKSGLSWLVSEHPSGNLSWVYDQQVVAIDVANQANLDDSSSSYDEYWRFPAMEQISFHSHTYNGSNAGIDQYRDDMRAHQFTDHAIVIFVTRFGTSWHAYSSGRRFILLSEHGNNWGNWGRSDLNFIAAHEMCHQFGARDEYSGKGTPCNSCGDTSGCDNIPNGNCEGCARPAQECIMRVHEPSMCNYTRGQVGWADIFVELFTDDDWWSGTDDHVELDIGFRTFTLDTPHHDDRENNNREGYALWAGGNLQRDEIKRILIRKGPDGFAGGWKLKRVRVFHDGDILCDKSPEKWLEDRERWYLACNFDNSLVNKLSLRVTTADVLWAGTDDDVTLRLAGRNWGIDSDADDFERNSTRTYHLDPKTGIRVSDLTTITVTKSPDGFAGGWKLGGLRLTVNDNHIYNNTSINQWLEDNDRVFSDAI